MTTVQRLAAVLDRFQDAPALRRLRLRLRELPEHDHDEVEQYRLLLKACRESPDLAAELVAAGFPDLTHAAPTPTDAEHGAVVQAFHEVVEAHWSRHTVRPSAMPPGGTDRSSGRPPDR